MPGLCKIRKNKQSSIKKDAVMFYILDAEHVKRHGMEINSY